MSVVVLYRGQRKTFKCGPAPMKAVADDAMQHFRISPTLECNLMHKNKKVDLCTPFRLSSIPNNALLELVCGDKNGKGATGAGSRETRLALSCDSGFGNLSGKFRSDMTLLEVLSFFVEQTPPLLPAPLLDASLSFTPPLEVIYLRQRFVGLEALGSCSLSSLGLAGSSARLQVRLPKAVTAPVGAPVPVVSGEEPTATIAIPSSSSSDVSATSVFDDTSANVSTRSSQGQSQAEEKQISSSNKASGYYVEMKGHPVHSSPSPLLPPPHQQEQAQVERRHENADTDQSPMKISPQESSVLNSAAQNPPSPPLAITLPSVHAAVKAILESNFDVASRKAIFTIVKYLDNLIKYPNPDDVTTDVTGLAKYRNINLGNAIVRENILSCNKGIELLLSLGFVMSEAVDVVPPVLDFSRLSSSASSGRRAPEKLTFGFTRVQQDWLLNSRATKGYTLKSADMCGVQGQEDGAGSGGVVLVSTLLDAREVLCAALAELSLSSSSSSQTAKDAPVPSPATTLSLLQSIARMQAPPEEQSSSSSSPPIVTFDPYKPFIMQAGTDKVVVKPPSSSSSSSTDAKLNQLNKRRLELEGDRSKVQRLTQVSVKGRSEKAAQKELSFSLGDQQVEETDGQIQARALKQVLMKLGAQDDEGPALTTRAVKELERAQRSVVHCQTLIKISLPDQVTLQAYFHPRDTVLDISQWLRSECFADLEGGASKGVDRVDVASATSGTSQYNFDLYTTPPRRSLFSPQLSEKSLQDLSLVPAAVIYLSWQGADAGVGSSWRGQGGTADRSYLSPTLLAKLSEENDDDLAIRSFPTGQKLVPSDSKSDGAGDEAGGKCGRVRGSANGGGEAMGGGGKKSVGKPKWFKL